MCGRYITSTESEIFAAQAFLNLNTPAIQQLSGDVFPSQQVNMLVSSGNGIRYQCGSWGFSRWDGKGSIINARSETAAVSRFFAPFYQSAYRCVLPAHGYYEWKKEGRNATQFAFTGFDPRGLFLAGLLRPEQDRTTFVILTRPAQAEFALIHDRMPLLIPPEDIAGWLCGALDAEAFLSLTHPLQAENLDYESSLLFES